MINYDTQDGFSVSSSQAHSSVSSVLAPSDAANIGSPPKNASLTAAAAATSSLGAGAAAASPSAAATSLTSQHNVVEIVPPPDGADGVHPQQQQQSHRQQQLLQQPMSTSVLTIQEVHFRHAGNYTCAPSNARSTSITVHVLKSKCYLEN